MASRAEKETLEPDTPAIFLALPPDGSTIGNARLRGQLSVDPQRYSVLASDLKARGLVVAGRGRGDSLALEFTWGLRGSTGPDALLVRDICTVTPS